MEFILAAIIMFTGIKVGQSWDRYAALQRQREYAALMRRIGR